MGTILSILKFISDLWTVLSQAVKMWQASKREEWIQDGQKITKAISEAKTDDERRALVRRLADSIHNTP